MNPVLTAPPAPVYSGASETRMPWPEPGLSVSPDQVAARYFTIASVPLLTAPELGQMLGIRTRTIYEWRRRGFLRERGLDDQGRWLFDVAEVAEVHATPGCRRRDLR